MSFDGPDYDGIEGARRGLGTKPNIIAGRDAHDNLQSNRTSGADRHRDRVRRATTCRRGSGRSASGMTARMREVRTTAIGAGSAPSRCLIEPGQRALREFTRDRR